MKKIKVIIEKSKDAYSGYGEHNVMINGMGDTVREVKESVLNSVEILKSLEPNQVPKELKEAMK